MDRTERFYKIDQLLKDSKVVTFARFQEALGVSRATLKRDLVYMRDRFNAPIEFDRSANGYRFGKTRAGPRYELPGLWFNATEIYALLTTLQLLGNLQPGILGAQVPALVERLRAILGSSDHSWKEVEKRIRIFQPEHREGNAAWFSVIAAALLKRSRLWIRHYNRNEDRVTEREVSPQRLVHYRDNWYLDAYCHLREDLRSFAVDAIQNAGLKETTAKEVPKAELDEYLGSGYGIFAGRKVEWATLKFTPRAARWVSAQRWHPDERHRVEKDGSYVLEIPYADDRELVMEIMKFGPDVEVLAPVVLRKHVADLHKEAARRYD
jgi:predicted DNA-binding transcriptional regulator YafY